ncbi:MAG: aldose 1-epimerase family protein [candidate division KSB1 bacterium]|nr:aldose 1-epimerase family protein [candidate division KSB1 bacterium]MDZ7276228.1 aldose 1-epimerase family protein [candidate division KSB1 bacterium]MDZ7287966.1 aldose 1-epimerase family protein [candidate division KSB1 bacterium]MDZ7300021.1 aldose 1-epimerase family protein [candidate division KSB1 bacterium]MDZ7308558.1 aldose 1-epimerase family protein [candidate division KSB1 bacterium]
MATLFDTTWTRAGLLAHVGDIRQLADVRLCELTDGPGRSVRLAEFKTGSGFSFTVLLDRGLDIHDAHYKGMALAWQSAGGITSPFLYEPEGLGWLRTFHGGWLNTCGLSNAGAPGSDELGAYGLHGRLSNLPAQLLGCGGRWLGDDYELWLEGCVRETAVFGCNLQLTRRLTTRLGESMLQIVDTIENLGDRPTPFMLLYHCNFGFPLLAAGSRVVINQKSVRPRDAVARAGFDSHLVIDPPQPGFAEQVFFHEAMAAADGMVTAAVINEALQLAGYVSYRQRELPELIEWKQMGAGTYVLGLEPANCLVMGRAAERERGTLRQLAPGETCETLLRLGVVEGPDAIDRLIKTIGGEGR